MKVNILFCLVLIENFIQCFWHQQSPHQTELLRSSPDVKLKFFLLDESCPFRPFSLRTEGQIICMLFILPWPQQCDPQQQTALTTGSGAAGRLTRFTVWSHTWQPSSLQKLSSCCCLATRDFCNLVFSYLHYFKAIFAERCLKHL